MRWCSPADAKAQAGAMWAQTVYATGADALAALHSQADFPDAV